MGAQPDERIQGIHHVTSVAGDPKTNVDFYTEILGLRMIKKTVNFDDPSTYHFYYGNRRGEPGTVLTFFPGRDRQDGKVGRGQTREVAFTVPEGALEYWRQRFRDLGVFTEQAEERFGEQVLRFRDHDGHSMELVEGDSDVEPWEEASVPEEHALRGIHGVTLDSREPGATAEVLEALGFERVGVRKSRMRFVGAGARARLIDVLDQPCDEQGRPGMGTVHHIALRTADEESQRAWREYLLDFGMDVTEPKDRFYFTSIYFREPGGILIEIATEGSGFTRDESLEELGEKLSLPPWLEENRAEIEAKLPGY